MWVPGKKYWDLIIRNGDELVWGLKGYTGGKKAGSSIMICLGPWVWEQSMKRGYSM